MKFSFERYRGSSAKALHERVARVEIVDANRVRFVLKAPWPDFLTFYATPATGAAWIVPKRSVERVGDDGFKRAPVGAGPYKLVSFSPGVELVLDANESYWRKVPSVKRLVFRAVPDESTRLAASLAINRKEINNAEYLGHGRLSASIIPRDFVFAWPAPAYPYDPERARRLLAEAGYPRGFDAVEVATDNTYAPVAEAVVNDLQAVGIRTRLRYSAPYEDLRLKK